MSAIDLDAGETVTCTFENRKQGNIIVKKETDRTASKRCSGSRRRTIRMASRSATAGRTSGRRGGLRVLGVGGRSGWLGTDQRHVQRRSPVSNITVSPGENVTCTFLNTRVGGDPPTFHLPPPPPPPPHASATSTTARSSASASTAPGGSRERAHGRPAT